MGGGTKNLSKNKIMNGRKNIINGIQIINRRKNIINGIQIHFEFILLTWGKP